MLIDFSWLVVLVLGIGEKSEGKSENIDLGDRASEAFERI